MPLIDLGRRFKELHHEWLKILVSLIVNPYVANFYKFLAFSIVGDPGGCNSAAGNADAGMRYIKVSELSGGAWASRVKRFGHSLV